MLGLGLALFLSLQSVVLEFDKRVLGPDMVVYPIDIRPNRREWLINDIREKRIRVVTDQLCFGPWFNPLPQDGEEWSAYVDTSDRPTKIIMQSVNGYKEVVLVIPTECQ